MSIVPSEDEMDNLRENIIKYTDHKGLSMRKLSELSGLSKNYVSNFINHYIEYPDLENIISIANVLDVELYMLFLPSNKTYGGIKKSIEIVMNVPKEELDLFIQLTNTIRDNQTN